MAVKMERDNGGNDPGDRESLDRYRQASAELDERPAASARAAILAAAAREVGAKPVDAKAQRPIRQRWPLAAAAAVMLSTLAVMLAIRTNEEIPQFSAPAEPPRAAADNAAPPAASPVPPPLPMTEQPSSKREAIEPQAAESRPARTRERLARAQDEVDAVAQAPRETNRPAPNKTPAPARAIEEQKALQDAPGLQKDGARQNAQGSSSATASAPVTVPAPASSAPSATPPTPEPEARAKLRTEQSAAGALGAALPRDKAGADARRDAVPPAAPSAPLSAAQDESRQKDDSAAAWLERIIKLRREGRHDEADTELKRFRERYPQVQLPAEALLPAGTR